MLRVIDEYLRGGLFQSEVLAVRAGERLAVPLPPAAAPGLGDGRQGALLPFADPVLSEQLAKFLRPDAALPGLDPADLGPVVQVLEGDRAQATAPQDTSSQLRMTAQAEADAWQQAADAEAEHDAAQADNARSLATAMAAETSRLEAANARYEEWSGRTAGTRERAGKAKAELQRRDQQPFAGAAPGPQSMATWWREFQAGAGAVDRAIEREHQAAVYDGQPWPPERKPEAAHEGPPAVAGGREPELEQSRPGTAGVQTDPEPDASVPEISAPEATGPGLADDGRAARLDDLQARADQAARRAELNASSEHSARLEREAQAEPAAGRQAETPYDMEMEL